MKKIKTDQQLKEDKSTRMMNAVIKYAAYYRENIHRFVEEYLGIKLKLFQKILLTGAAPAHIRWNWVTPAAVTLCPGGIILSKDGVEMKLSSDTSIPLHWRIYTMSTLTRT